MVIEAGGEMRLVHRQVGVPGLGAATHDLLINFGQVSLCPAQIRPFEADRGSWTNPIVHL